jgi:hypothetical protein
MYRVQWQTKVNQLDLVLSARLSASSEGFIKQEQVKEHMCKLDTYNIAQDCDNLSLLSV